jgi:hypothetical protein
VNYLARPDSEKSRHGIICEVYETPPPQSVLFDYEFVAPVRLEYEWPKVLWLGPDSYADNALWLLFDPAWRSPALLDLYLKPLLSSGPTWLGVESTGWTLPTEVEPGGAFKRPTRTLETYFTSYFAERRVIVLAQDTDSPLRSIGCAGMGADASDRVLRGWGSLRCPPP